jgi:cardiolipin synthase
LLPLVAGTVGCGTTRQVESARLARDQPYAAGDPRFLHRTAYLLDTVTLPGNRMREYINGSSFFPIMLESIRSAEHTVTLATYIYWRGEVGRQFSEALAERARAGVQVLISVDWLGSRCLDRRELELLRTAGAEVHFFNRFSWLRPLRLNHRDHRKLLVVDGRVGFIGGAGIADCWDGNAHSTRHWRDGFYRVEGPVVAQLQDAFMQNWERIAGSGERGPGFFPALEPAGTDAAHVFFNTAGANTDRVRLFYLLAFEAARESIRISMAYFIPCQATRQALVDACRRGVRVEIILPNSRMDSRLVRPLSRRHFGDLLEAGARIYEYQPSMYHAKCVIVDEALVSVGSANMDERTYRFNDEANLNVLSPEFAASQICVFEADKQRAREISYAAWNQRPFTARLTEYLMAPWEPWF